MLLDEYPGHDAWAAYAAVFRPELGAVERQALRTLIPQDGDLAETLAGVLGEGAVAAWLDQPTQALDGLTPADVIASRPGGYKIVRHAVMRMPV